jgi:hypothetical protein
VNLWSFQVDAGLLSYWRDFLQVAIEIPLSFIPHTNSCSVYAVLESYFDMLVRAGCTGTALIVGSQCLLLKIQNFPRAVREMGAIALSDPGTTGFTSW